MGNECLRHRLPCRGGTAQDVVAQQLCRGGAQGQPRALVAGGHQHPLGPWHGAHRRRSGLQAGEQARRGASMLRLCLWQAKPDGKLSAGMLPASHSRPFFEEGWNAFSPQPFPARLDAPLQNRSQPHSTGIPRYTIRTTPLAFPATQAAPLTTA